MQTIKVGLLGLGTVGSGVVSVLRENAKEIEGRLGAKIEVARIAIKDPDKTRSVMVRADVLTGDADAVVDDPEVQIVVELIGGTDRAREDLTAVLGEQRLVGGDDMFLGVDRPQHE